MSLTIKSTVQLTSGHAMPLLGFGVYQNYNTRPSVLTAFAAGYRHVDSAQAYKNEAEVGEAVRESGLERSDVFITTKCISKTHGYDSTLEGVDESLARFGFDYIDLFLIHDPFSGTERRLATYRALLDAQKAGKIRTVGVSNYGVKHLEEIKSAGLQMPAVDQIEACSIFHCHLNERPIVDYCRTHEIVVQAYCPILRGKTDNPVIQAMAQKVRTIIAAPHQRPHAFHPIDLARARSRSDTHQMVLAERIVLHHFFLFLQICPPSKVGYFQ
ncbi:Aldo/keto reductase [Butyriboletus roseoflavus]|nr:Aldo/keto reductase [Butyriboletus roseoflavus]